MLRFRRQAGAEAATAVHGLRCRPRPATAPRREGFRGFWTSAAPVDAGSESMFLLGRTQHGTAPLLEGFSSNLVTALEAPKSATPRWGFTCLGDDPPCFSTSALFNSWPLSVGFWRFRKGKVPTDSLQTYPNVSESPEGGRGSYSHVQGLIPPAFTPKAGRFL